MSNEIVIMWDASPSPVSGYNVYRGTLPGNESSIPYNSSLVTSLPVMLLTSVAASVSGSAVYTGTIPGGAGNAMAGFSFTVAGFAPVLGAEGTFACTASTATTLTLSNPTASAGSASATAKQVPQFIDTAVFPGRVYSYEITAVMNGVESADSIGLLSAPVPFGFSPSGPSLNGLDNFEVLAATTITSTGATTIAGDIGVYPGTALTGFPPAIISGVSHLADYVSQAGQTAALSLYNALVAYASDHTISGDIGGQTLTPGTYTSTSTVGITGVLTLDAVGDPNAVWVFQVGSALSTAASNSQITLINGAQAANVYWQVGSSATIGTDTTFVGTVVAQVSITVNTAAQIDGRLLALTGAITLDDNSIMLTNSAPFTLYASNTAYTVGEVIFDCASGMFEEVTIAGTTQVAPRPTFPSVASVYTMDGTVQWLSISPVGVIINLPLPPSPPNVAPLPPTAPQNPRITLEN